MSLESDFLAAFETHAPDAIRAALARGASATALINGKTPIETLVEGYLRSPRFAECLRVLIDAGASTGDSLLEALLLDDEAALLELVRCDRRIVESGLSIRCAFTTCAGVTPLHICAEFNSVRCGRVLLAAGADVNAPADRDADGFGGQTPVFHAVNSIVNFCRPMMELLVEAGADLDVRLRGVVWGPDADWETLVLDVTPISYAQCGMYSQFHRREEDISSNLAYLFERRHRKPLRQRNVPNRYLAK